MDTAHRCAGFLFVDDDNTSDGQTPYGQIVTRPTGSLLRSVYQRLVRPFHVYG
jgi:hypothetical protein